MLRYGLMYIVTKESFRWMIEFVEGRHVEVDLLDIDLTDSQKYQLSSYIFLGLFFRFVHTYLHSETKVSFNNNSINDRNTYHLPEGRMEVQ